MYVFISSHVSGLSLPEVSEASKHGTEDQDLDQADEHEARDQVEVKSEPENQDKALVKDDDKVVEKKVLPISLLF